MSLPAGARRLVPHYDADSLDPRRAGSLLLSRLLEDGDAADLAWLFATFPEAEVAAWLLRHGRRLSRRSRAFWSAVLGVEAGAPPAAAEALWPL